MQVAKVGQAAPDFEIACVDAQDGACRRVTLQDYATGWLMLLFYPRDFSFVCPTELTSFNARIPDFRQRDCRLMGVSVDSIELHREWLNTPPAEGGLGTLRFPLASDPAGSLARAYGVWIEDKQVSTRGLFIIDPNGILQYAVVHNLNVGRSPDEILRVLDALQTGGLCPANWTSADGTIDVERALQPGRVLGHYRMRKLLGSGTFGSVFAAWDLRLERMVALKVLKSSAFESREIVLAEARTSARLNHPHVCTVYAVEEEDGLPLIAMEYLDGQPLSQAVAEGLSREVALRLAKQIASGLAAAHEQHVVHGDLKPANVFVTRQGLAKILDFGLARCQQIDKATGADAAQDEASRATGDSADDVSDADETLDYVGSDIAEGRRIQGTPAYMSPEQAMGQRLTPASDVFSFGLMLFEMLTGRAALSDRSLTRILARVRMQDLASELAAQVDDAHGPLLAAMLARDAVRRPSMNEVRQRLK